MKLYRPICLIFVIAFSIISSYSQSPKREFRGIWLATVNNIDWPSKAGLTVEDQKSELLSLLDQLEALHFNAVIFQIRPAGDAFYNSQTEPWSQWLMGKQGLAPANNWDPLHFITKECHQRGMELHAWMNPFRLSQNLNTTYSSRSIARRHPDWVVNYGNRQYLDPGIPGVRNYLNSVVSEVVRKYDVDAIHFDDYFYPYPIAKTPFPDSLSFVQYNRGHTATEINSWRRENVDLIIESLNQTIKHLKPRVKFGISPFGVWKNYDENDEMAGSVTTAGTTNYDNLYADVIKWQQKGWIDYMIPQLYWEIGHSSVDFITLANWWSERSFGHHVYVGHALYKLVEGKSSAWKNSEELPEQIMISRRMKNIEGSAYFRMRYLEKNPLGIKDRLLQDIYQEKALLPTMPWLDNKKPAQPTKVKLKGLFKKNKLSIKYAKKKPQSADHLGYLVYTSTSKEKVDIENPSNMLCFSQQDIIDLSKQKRPNKDCFLWISVLDKQHNESAPQGGILWKK
jgi:uncharacterized lipoprotein YddW (UPF0748 family)